MEKIANKFDNNQNDDYHLYQKIPNSINNSELYAEKDLGTTIVAVQYDKGVLMAADSRTSSVIK